ncbi:MAG: thymidine phosphorylase [Candidatus Fimivivens sp.]
MRMYDIIHKKRDGDVLTREELKFFVEGVADSSIPDYQISALMMAVYFQKMSRRETADLTDLMAHSGDMVDLSPIEGFKVDKHSTGGVGDKTTLIVAPIVAACGIRVAKMSGRGLGHTGGTVDKLESIPGFCTALSTTQFFDVVRKVGVSVVGQTGNLAPADKKLYALRDVTATVENISLIAASIMSKKLASGANGIVLDVKTGSGAFMKTVSDAIELAEEMVSIGVHTRRKTAALITDMDCPLGLAIGNTLEVVEAVETLRGHGPEDLATVSLELAANMLYLGDKGDIAYCRTLAREAISGGKAFETLCDMVEAQGGDSAVLRDTSLFKKAGVRQTVKAPCAGYVTTMNTEEIGNTSVLLGAGRETKESAIDFAAGIMLHAKCGQWVDADAPLATVYTNRSDTLLPAEERLLAAFKIDSAPPAKRPLIFARVSLDGVEYYE